MATRSRFEDLQVWKAARLLANRIYDLTDGVTFSKDFGLKDQIRRAAVSVLSNIAEGSERGTDDDFAHFLFMAKGSSGEVRAQLYIALDRQYVSQSDFAEANSLCEQISRQLSHFISYLKGRRPPAAATKAGGAGDESAYGATKDGAERPLSAATPRLDGAQRPLSAATPRFDGAQRLETPRSGLRPTTTPRLDNHGH